MELALWDTAGQEEYDRVGLLNNISMISVHCCFVSFENAFLGNEKILSKNKKN